MAANAAAQHRCVFVGNIPYDATEEQLIQICEEVGPVVSFRLVTDRETGKPKGYGFCEYKDEETALSARRNLQGYEVNGRQLRVDFAENDKNNADRTREQGRGGPGTVTTIDPSKQFGVPVVPQDHSLLQPLGERIASAAAIVMAGALGSAQAAGTNNLVGLQNQTQLGTDPLTLHLAKMSSSQLTEIMSELKELAIQDKEKARILLRTFPTLPKALFQAQLMLGMVTPQMLQMPNILQASTQPVQPLKQSVLATTGLPPLPENKMQFGSLPQAHESPGPAGVSNSNPYAAVPSLPIPSQIQHPQLAQNQILQQGQVLVRPGVSSLPAVQPESLVGLPVRPHNQALTSSLLNQQFQPPLSQNMGQVPSVKSTYHGHLSTQNTSMLTFAVTRPQFSAESYQQPPLSTSSPLPESLDLKGHVLPGNTSIASDNRDQMNRPSKMMKLNDGRAPPSLKADSAPITVPSQTSGPLGRQTSIAQETLNAGSQDNKLQLPSNVDSTLLQQVLNLTPEQLNSLPPDQQQQVIELQQMLRQAS